ncbi:sulfotransferase domain-containing protein [Roseibacillus persicicus]|nr:sulfotransferase domain-containing protein [Roseibacillus persicicus]
MNRFPDAYIAISKQVSEHYLFSTERAFLRGSLQLEPSKPSYAFYAANRAGSMLLKRTMAALAAENGREHLDLQRYFVHTDRRRLERLEDETWVRERLMGGGFCLGPLRAPLPPSVLDTIPSIALIRDPRDIVVSHYYAVTSAHTIFDRSFLEMKEAAENMTIDEYALSFAEEAFGQAISFAKLCERENQTLFKYEDFMSDYEGVLKQVSKALNLNPPSQELREQLKAEVAAPGKGDRSQHKRSGLHGQFNKELMPETVEQLNRIYESELQQLNYL